MIFRMVALVVSLLPFVADTIRRPSALISDAIVEVPASETVEPTWPPVAVLSITTLVNPSSASTTVKTASDPLELSWGDPFNSPPRMTLAPTWLPFSAFTTETVVSVPSKLATRSRVPSELNCTDTAWSALRLISTRVDPEDRLMTKAWVR